MIANKIKQLIKRNQGMTLLDMALALLLIGLIAAPLIQIYNQWRMDEERGTTYSAIFTANKAASDFYFESGRYACPALPNLGPGHPDYGIENCDDTEMVAGSGILAGSVPFVTLRIPESQTLDGFNQKIGYVVTAALTHLGPLGEPIDPHQGALAMYEHVLNEYGQCTEELRDGTETDNSPAGSGQYALISHGPSGVGAYTQTGALIRACPVNDSQPSWTADAENCNNDAILLTEHCSKSDKRGSGFYDDIFYGQYTLPARIWNYSNSENVEDIFSRRTIMTGVHNPVADVDLDVIGNVLTQPEDSGVGFVQAGLICPVGTAANSNADCFNPAIIGGTDPDMDCRFPNETDRWISTGMTGLVGSDGNVDAQCAVTYAEGVSGECGEDEYMIGFDPSGEILCAPPPPTCAISGQILQYDASYQVICVCPAGQEIIDGACAAPPPPLPPEDEIIGGEDAEVIAPPPAIPPAAPPAEKPPAVPPAKK